ncbi:MAG TPA: hypothetical protein DIS93_15085 [Bdellovibrionales bacterium]|nr:hypothetical protein [Bdellovibrionales bacterium]
MSSSEISNAQQISQKKRGTQLKLLNQLSTRLQSLLESDNVYQEIINIIQAHFNYYCINIWSVDEEVFTLRAQAGNYHSHLKIGHRIPSNEGITGAVLASKQPYLCPDVSKDQHYKNLEIAIGTKSELCVPILSRTGAVMAALNLESDSENAFDQDDVITLEAVAWQVAVAIGNQRLYSDVKHFNRKLQSAVEDKTLELRRAHERILDQQKLLQKENKALKSLVDQDQQKGMEIIGKSPTLLSLIAMVDKIAPTTASVLIQGESGTGKELIARRLHLKGDRAGKPYVTVNCGALQESLLESELFGHEKGSFTGAVSQKMGLCETADGGTLFLDEIGELSLGIQAKLLRFLQEGEFYRIGGKRPIKVDVRIVSATNRDLEREVKEGRFREDLFYRFNTITLRMPPLRKRKEDIPALVEFFIKSSRFGGATLQIRKIDPRVIDVLMNYNWPGNIRELQNTIERLKILAENNEIRLDDIPFNIRMPKMKTENSEFAIDMPLEEVEKHHILRALTFNHGNKTKTAQSLGITIKTLYNKLHRYGFLETPAEQPEAMA